MYLQLSRWCVRVPWHRAEGPRAYLHSSGFLPQELGDGRGKQTKNTRALARPPSGEVPTLLRALPTVRQIVPLLRTLRIVLRQQSGA